MPEHDGAIVVGVLVEDNADRSARQQLRQLRLALAERQRPEILAGSSRSNALQHRVAGLVPAVERVEVATPSAPETTAAVNL